MKRVLSLLTRGRQALTRKRKVAALDPEVVVLNPEVEDPNLEIEDPNPEMARAIKIRSQCTHFRILVIGRANAGKTTLLKRVCETTDEPRIYDPNGKEIDPSVVVPSEQRGLHNIENQLVFASNPQFVFHDSMGFEAGGTGELEAVKAFIASRAKANHMSKQLHAIWYCLPTDSNRPLLAADQVFFEECGTGKVPVIAIFTKFDALITTAFGELRKQGATWAEAKDKALIHAMEKLKEDYIDQLYKSKFKPKRHVWLRDMQQGVTTCLELIKETSQAIDDSALKLLFVSVQQSNIDLCIRTAMEISIGSFKIGLDDKTIHELVRNILVWFPHSWVQWNYSEDVAVSSCLVIKSVCSALTATSTV